jgi:hypothetical protein
MPEQRIACPKCGHRFPVTRALTAQVEAAIRRDYDARLKAQRRATEEEFEERVDKELARMQRQALRDAKVEARGAVSAELAALRSEMRDRDKTIRQMQSREAGIARRETTLSSREKSLQATVAREVEGARRRAVQETTKAVEEQYHDKELQFRKVEADLRTRLRDATRRLEQSSQQLQGEVVELELESRLRSAFPGDEIVPVPQGKHGADVLQRVASPTGKSCGTIIWESKRTKNWSAGWIPKLKSDQRREKAEIAVLVSSALPKELGCQFGQVSGVWVTDYSLVPALATALRANLIDVARVKMSAEGKSDKMEILYRYVMSTEFRQRVEAIVEAFTAMREDLDKERQSAERQWAKRETQLRLVIENLAGAIGDIQAIAPAFPKIRRLELPAPEVA